MSQIENKQNEGLKPNISLRDLLIKRERQKALREYLRMSPQNGLSFPKGSNLQLAEKDIDAKTAQFIHANRKIQQAYAAWRLNRKADVNFIRIEDRHGGRFLTFDKEAAKTARILDLKTKQTKVKNKMVSFITVPENKMNRTLNILAQRDLKTNLSNTRAQQVSIARKQTKSPTPSVTIQPKTPKLDVMESLDKNRKDARQSTIHVESLSVKCDSKGHWMVSGLVNGQSVSAQNIQQSDAFSYKKGEMTGEELVAKYHLQEQPKQQTSISKKNTLARRYSLDGSAS